MKVYSDVLDSTDLVQNTPHQVYASVTPLQRPHKRHKGWIVSLEFLGEKVKSDGRRYRNSGQYGAEASPYNLAATYDEHGEWMSRLYDIDPNAIIACYKSRDNFNSQTCGGYLDDEDDAREYLSDRLREIGFSELANRIDNGDDASDVLSDAGWGGAYILKRWISARENHAQKVTTS